MHDCMHTLNETPGIAGVGNDAGVPVHTVLGSIWLMVGSLRNPGSVNRIYWVYVGLKHRPSCIRLERQGDPRTKFLEVIP